MRGRVRPTDYPRLPGPARFIADMVSDLDAGRSVLAVFPDAAIESGIADAVLDDAAREGVTVEYCVESDEHFPARVLNTFGSDSVLNRGYDEWDSIINWEPWHRSWVILQGWQHRDIGEIVERWPAQLKACGLSIEDRPKLLIAVSLNELSRKTISHIDRDCVAVHWWWGVFDRLDTETRLVATTQRRLNPLDTAVVVEVAGWDLECAEFLAENWDRSTGGLPHALMQYRESRSWTSGPDSPNNTDSYRVSAAPPAELENDWRAGLVDRWGLGIRSAPHTLGDKEVAQRIWMAHNRTLIPYVDEERAYFERVILRKASLRALDGMRRRDDDIIEIGSLAWLVSSRRVDIGKEARLRLQAFRDLRNDLAHRRPVGDKLLSKILGYLGIQ